MNIELKLIRISVKAILKTLAVSFVLVNMGAWFAIKYGVGESIWDLFLEEWILLEVLVVLVGLLLATGKSKAEMIFFYDIQPIFVRQRLERWMKIKAFKRTQIGFGVEVWKCTSFFKRLVNLFESDIRIESTERMVKITGPKKYVLHIKNKLIWSRDLAPTQTVHQEELAEV